MYVSPGLFSSSRQIKPSAPSPTFAGRYIVDEPEPTVRPSGKLKKLKKKRKLAEILAKPVVFTTIPLMGFLGAMGLSFSTDADLIKDGYSATAKAGHLSEQMNKALTPEPDAIEDNTLKLSDQEKAAINSSEARQQLYTGFAAINEDYLSPQGVANLSEASIQKAVDDFTPLQVMQTNRMINQMIAADKDDEKINLMMDWYQEVLGPKLVVNGDMSLSEMQAVQTVTRQVMADYAADHAEAGQAFEMLLMSLMGLPVSMMLSLLALGGAQRYRRLEGEERQRLKDLQGLE